MEHLEHDDANRQFPDAARAGRTATGSVALTMMRGSSGNVSVS